MGLTGVSVGFTLLAVAAWAWTITAVTNGDDEQVALGFAVAGVGFGLGSWATRNDVKDSPGRLALGLGLAVAGFAPFLATFDFADVDGYLVAILLFMTGLVVAFGSAATGWHTRRPAWLVAARAGAALALIAPLFWVVLDTDGGWEWQPGNVLSLVGLALVTWKMREQNPEPLGSSREKLSP